MIYIDGSLKAPTKCKFLSQYSRLYNLDNNNLHEKEIGAYSCIIIDPYLAKLDGIYTGILEDVTSTDCEFYAAYTALKQGLSNNIGEIIIVHDLDRVDLYRYNKTKTSPIYNKYKNLFLECISNGMDIKFIQVKSHSNDEFNNMADIVAKASIYKFNGLNNVHRYFNNMDEFRKYKLNNN